MAIDFIYFDVEEYRSRVKALTDQELQKKEVVKIRNAHSGTAGIISGAVLAPVTGGASLFATVAGGRTIHVADQKLEVIRAELVRRRLPLHTQTTRDQAIPAIFGGITGCMGLNMGLEGAVTAKAASVFANNSAITTSAPLDRVRTAPSEPSSSFAATTWRRLRRSHTDTEVSRYRLAQFPYTAEERQLFRQFDGLVAREHALRQQYLRLRNATLAAAGTKWYSYVVHLYPCVPETLVVPTEADVWITQLRRRTDSRGQWDMDTQQHFSSWARDGLKTFQGDLDAVSARLDKWQLLVLKCLPPGPVAAPNDSAEGVLALNRKITVFLAPVLCYWILKLSILRLAFRLIFILLLGFGVHARLLWDYEMYPFSPAMFAKS